MTDFAWKRFWRTEADAGFGDGGGRSLLDESGFLRDPDAFLDSLSTAWYPLDHWNGTRCLVLLGESGLGKSIELERRRDRAPEFASLLKLAECDRSDLDRAIDVAVGQPSRQDTGGAREILLDAFDASPIAPRVLGAVLRDASVRLSGAGLNLRLTCKSGMWLDSLADELRTAWSDEFAVLQLLPLRQQDVRLAAEQWGLDPSQFLRDVATRGAEGLAMTPVCLLPLLRQAKAGLMPDTRSDLYREELRRLCSRQSEGAGRPDPQAMDPDDLMAIAERLAACALLSGKTTFTVDDSVGSFSDALSISEVTGPEERSATDGQRVQIRVSEGAVRTTLNTGLFSRVRVGRYRFAHDTYAEFLAARFFAGRDFNVAQIRSLIGTSRSSSLRILPRFRGLAAWLAAWHTDFRRELLAHQPELTLTSELPEGVRPEAVQGVLEAVQTSRMRRRRGFRPFLYRGLRHPALEQQVRPWLTDRTRSTETRQVAIDIAEGCGCSELAADLAGLALDPDEAHDLRANAALAVYLLGDEKAKASLHPLAFGRAGDDPDDELRGAALLACWPKHLSVEELLACLSPRKEASLSGLYSGFLYSEETVEAIQSADLAAVLDWCQQWVAKASSERHRMPIIDGVMRVALRQLDVPEVLEAVARLVLARLDRHLPMVDSASALLGRTKESPVGDAAVRRKLLAALLPRVGQRGVWPLHESPPLATREDFVWLADLAKHADAATVTTIHRLAGPLYDRLDPLHRQTVQQLATLQGELSDWGRSALEQFASEPRAAEPAQPRWLKRVSRVVASAPTGTAALWKRITSECALVGARGLDLRGTLTIDERQKLVAAARDFLETTHLDANDGYAGEAGSLSRDALILLAAEDPGIVRAFDVARWREWAPLVPTVADVSGHAGEEAAGRLVRVAHGADAGALRASVVQLLESGSAVQLHVFDEVRDDAFDRAIAGSLERGALNLGQVHYVLRTLLGKRSSAAIETVREFVTRHATAHEIEPPASWLAASYLLTYAPDRAWDIVWPASRADAEWGRRVWVNAGLDRDGRRRLSDIVTEHEIGEAVRWGLAQFPVTQRPPFRESGLTWSLLDALKERGTADGWEVLRSLAAELPQHPWLVDYAREAEEAWHVASWIPAGPQDVLQLARGRMRRRVTSPVELLDVLVESLDRLGEKHYGDLNPVRFLWKGRKGRQCPCEEEDLSDWIALHLRQDLAERRIVVNVNREVQIRRRTYPGGEPGQRTDIRIDLAVDGDPLTAFIEVKGSWHNEVTTAMKTQLVDRYLHDHQCRAGLYVVGWFNCPAWNDPGDSRSTRSQSESLEDCQRHLHAQALEVMATSATRGPVVRSYVMDCRLT